MEKKPRHASAASDRASSRPAPKLSASTSTERFTTGDLVRSIWYFIAEDRAKYAFFSVLLMAALAYEFVPPWLVGKIITFLTDRKQGSTLAPLFWMTAILVASNAAISITRLVSKRALGDQAIDARYRAKVWGFERLLNFSLAWHQQESTGNKAQRIITGSESIREWTRDLGNVILPTFITFTGTLVTCLVLSPWFILFFAYYLGVFILIEQWFDRRILILSDRINASMENASGTFVESTSNILSVKALGAGESVTEKVVNREENARVLSQERNHLGTRKWMFFQIHNSIAWGVYLVAIGLSVAAGKVPIAMFLTYSMYFFNMRGNVTQFVEQFQLMIERRSNLCRMMPFFRTVENASPGTEAFPEAWDEIAFVEVNFKYADKRVLHGLDLRVARGEVVGIAGHSGSGKSTLVKLILGLYAPESGAVRIGNRSVRDIRYEELTAHVSVVLQETELFNLTLRENITMMRKVDAEVFARACRIACLEEVIARLPHGLDTVIGERGYTLSGGERQRLGIARAVCRDADILLLDEATSALDNATEEQVMARLSGELPDGKTIIMIAHRTTTLRGADRILVFDHGQVTKTGTYEAIFA